MDNLNVENANAEATPAGFRSEGTLEAMNDESYRDLNRMMNAAASRRVINMMHMEPTR